MSAFEIKVAERQGARLLIQLSGPSGSGKTLTAILLAYGLVDGDGSKVIGIDAENRRMSLNASPSTYEMVAQQLGRKKPVSPFRVIEFFAPFSPSRYIEAIDAACKAGAEVIVIDSTSHEWEGEGGCESIANAGNSKMPNWKLAKKEHKRFMNFMLQCPAHIIACTRAREKTDFKDTSKPVSLGMQPIQEKNFSYEATVSLMMWNQGHDQTVLKCPSELQHIMGRGTGYITAADGAALRAWVDGGAKVDQTVEHWRGMLVNECEKGLQAFKDLWNSMPLEGGIRKKLGDQFRDQCAASALEYDRQREQAAADAAEQAGTGTAAAFGGINQQADMMARAPAPPPRPRPAPAPVAAAPAAEPAAPVQDQHPHPAEPTGEDGAIF